MTFSLDGKSGWSCIRHAPADAITESTFNASPLTPCTDGSNGSFHSVNQQAYRRTQTPDHVHAHTRNGHLCDDSSSLEVSGVDWVQFSMSWVSSECETVHHQLQAEHFFYSWTRRTAAQNIKTIWLMLSLPDDTLQINNVSDCFYRSYEKCNTHLQEVRWRWGFGMELFLFFLYNIKLMFLFVCMILVFSQAWFSLGEKEGEYFKFLCFTIYVCTCMHCIYVCVYMNMS